MEADRALLRHTVATLAYRGAKAVRGAPDSFAEFRVKGGMRTPGEILAHIGDLLDWALAIAQGKPAWHNSSPFSWNQEVDRFFTALAAFDAYLGSENTLSAPSEKLFQGPIANALTHVGQISMLRRLHGAPVRAENYFVAEIASGRVGKDQTAPRREFD